MYTRSYDEKHGFVIPESYSGTLLREDQSLGENEDYLPPNEARINERSYCEKEDVHRDNESRHEQTFSFIERLPFGNFLSDIFKKGNFSLQKVGTEEVLIIATSAFLLFSKDGDKECAIMLLLLLFLT